MISRQSWKSHIGIIGQTKSHSSCLASSFLHSFKCNIIQHHFRQKKASGEVMWFHKTFEFEVKKEYIQSNILFEHLHHWLKAMQLWNILKPLTSKLFIFPHHNFASHPLPAHRLNIHEGPVTEPLGSLTSARGPILDNLGPIHLLSQWALWISLAAVDFLIFYVVYQQLPHPPINFSQTAVGYGIIHTSHTSWWINAEK